MLTGCRKNEIMTLRWKHVDLDRAEIRIVNGKTGDRMVYLSPSAVNVLAALPGETLPLVGGLLGHRRHRTTAGYTQIADAHLIDATERIGCIILRTTTSARRSTCFRQTAQNDNNRPRSLVQ